MKTICVKGNKNGQCLLVITLYQQKDFFFRNSGRSCAKVRKKIAANVLKTLQEPCRLKQKKVVQLYLKNFRQLYLQFQNLKVSTTMKKNQTSKNLDSCMFEDIFSR